MMENKIIKSNIRKENLSSHEEKNLSSLNNLPELIEDIMEDSCVNPENLHEEHCIGHGNIFTHLSRMIVKQLQMRILKDSWISI